jgi:hypothetical protein
MRHILRAGDDGLITEPDLLRRSRQESANQSKHSQNKYPKGALLVPENAWPSLLDQDEACAQAGLDAVKDLFNTNPGN